MEKLTFDQLPDGFHFVTENKLDWDTLYQRVGEFTAKVIASPNKKLIGTFVRFDLDQTVYL